MRKIFNVIVAFVAATLFFSACESTGVGVAYPKEPRIEFELDGYTAVIGENSQETSFILRWINEETATYDVYLGSLNSEEVYQISTASSPIKI